MISEQKIMLAYSIEQKMHQTESFATIKNGMLGLTIEKWVLEVKPDTCGTKIVITFDLPKKLLDLAQEQAYLQVQKAQADRKSLLLKFHKLLVELMYILNEPYMSHILQLYTHAFYAPSLSVCAFSV
ncbi:hypothetical protein ACJX0J_008162 [Zea mays]